MRDGKDQSLRNRIYIIPMENANVVAFFIGIM